MSEYPKLLLKFFYLGKTWYLIDEGKDDEYQNDRFHVAPEGTATAHHFKDKVPEIK
jgi:hypothetical protein